MDAAAAELFSHPLFSVLSDAARRDLSAAVTRRRVRRLEIIYSTGSPIDAAFLVRRGCVKVSRLSADGREITLFLCHPGELFGEEALVAALDPDHRDGSVRRACQAQALEECMLAVLPALLLQRLVREEAVLVGRVARLLVDRWEQAEDQIEDLAFRDVGGRLARLLISLASRQGVAMADGRILLKTRLTHQELASCVGTTRETLTLTIDRFQADGWIKLDRRMIAICRPEALRARAGVAAMSMSDERRGLVSEE